MCLSEAVATARRYGAARTYLTGFGHEVSHDEYVQIGEAIERGDPAASLNLSGSENVWIDAIVEGKPIWVRPSYDGLRISVSDDGNVRDECYD